MDSEKFSARRYIPSVTTRVRISECVKCATVEAANASCFRSRPPTPRRRVIQRANECPPRLRAREQHGLAIVTSCDNTIFASPGQRDIRQSTDPDVLDDGPPGIDNVDRAVVACGRHSQENMGEITLTRKRQNIPRRRKADCMDPSASGAGILAAHCVERKFFSPDSRSRPGGNMSVISE